MLVTHRDPDHHANRPIAIHGRGKPDAQIVLAMIKLRLTELPALSIRRQALERMVELMQD